MNESGPNEANNGGPSVIFSQLFPDDSQVFLHGTCVSVGVFLGAVCEMIGCMRMMRIFS